MVNKATDKGLWTRRSIEETKAVYADWADSYDDNMAQMAYATPDRIAAALQEVGAQAACPILDFGCGTGLSGAALARAGFTTIDGTDISPEMLAQARSKTIYRHLTLGTPGQVDVEKGAYDIIIATGVISLGAAPPEMLGALLDVLKTSGLLAFSFNDPTLNDPIYINALQDVVDLKKAEIIFRKHGPHLSEKVTGSDVIVLRRL